MPEVAEPDKFLAETKAGGLLLRYSINTPGFDIVALARVLGIDVEYGGLEQIEAWLLRRNDGLGVIRVKSSPYQNRQRFSIAHEIGHWVLHEGRSQGYLCTVKDLTDYRRSPEEVEANVFAASLLIPRHFIDAAIFSRDPNFAQVQLLADKCKTSITSSARRIVELSTRKLVLVCSWNGKIEWAIASKPAKWCQVDRENLPAKSYTRRAFAIQADTTNQPPLHPSDWFPHRDFDRKVELFEEVKYF